MKFFYWISKISVTPAQIRKQALHALTLLQIPLWTNCFRNVS